MSYYSLLGLTKEATSDDIKKAYHRLALQSHPDKCGHSDDFLLIAEAYNVLMNSESRAAYERVGV
jgi:DnaJ-class molecular chaperone